MKTKKIPTVAYIPNFKTKIASYLTKGKEYPIIKGSIDEYLFVIINDIGTNSVCSLRKCGH